MAQHLEGQDQQEGENSMRKGPGPGGHCGPKLLLREFGFCYMSNGELLKDFKQRSDMIE